MKALLALLAVLILVPVAGARTYSTTFPNTENPLSESNNWVNGGATGLLWHDCRSTAGFAFGTQPATINYDDSTCVLGGTWGADQTVQATVHIGAADSTQFEEVELRVHTTITANSITGYEINCSVKPGNPYIQIVRWNGPLGNFMLIDSRSVGCANGDVLKATIVGSTITAYKNGTQILQVTDSVYGGGAPGMGFYIQNGSASTNSDFGFSNFTATDGQPPPPTNLTATVH